jgi:hypothetical protein
MRLPNADHIEGQQFKCVRIRIPNKLVRLFCHCCLLSFSCVATCNNVDLGKFFENILLSGIRTPWAATSGGSTSEVGTPRASLWPLSRSHISQASSTRNKAFL